jgi:DNA-binding cell septation regulator SpoVG
MNSNVKLDVRVYPVDEPKGSTVAFANVGINDTVAISGIRVVQGERGAFVAMPQSQDKEGKVVDGEKGLFVTMPQSKDKNNEYHDIAFPINGDLRKEINKTVLAVYDKEAVKDRTSERGDFTEKLSQNKEKAAQYVKPAPVESAAKKSPGLGD